MASPFAMFRRNQQTLLVVLFILAIFAFTLSDLLTSQTPNLPMLGLIVGTCILTAIGAVVKQPAKYAAIGAVGGLLVGTGARLFVTPNAPDTVASTKLGAVTAMDMQRFLSERKIANDFIRYAAQQAVGPQEAGQLVNAYAFGVAGANTPEEVAVLNVILLEEAKRLGIRIDNATVSDYINLATNNRLSKTAYEEILQSMGVSDGQLYQILQEQIAIRTAQQQLMPTGSMTPEQFWEMFKKLNFSQKIQSVAVPVEALAEKIPEPEEGELRAFFEAHKNSFPGEPEPESVGFRQPRKVQLAYIEAGYLDLEATVDEITDAEIEEFYEENKDPRYLNRQVPDDPLGGDPFGGDTGSGATGPDLGEPNTPGPQLDFDSLIPETTPESDAAKPQADEAPAPEAPLKADKSPSGAPKKNQTTEESPGPPERPQLPEPGNKPGDEKSADPDSQSVIDRTGATLQPVSFVQEAKETENQESPADTEDADAAPETSESSVKSVKPKSETADESRDKETESEADTSGSKALPPAPETGLEAPLVAPRPAPPKYRPLDDLLRDEIRDTLLRQRTNEKQQKLASLVLDRMTELSNEYFDLVSDEADDETMSKFIRNAQQELQELAEEHGLTYRQTPLMSASELSLSAEHPVGSAAIGMELSNSSRETVTDYVFTMPPESVYEANVARSLDPDSIYVFWKTADRESHVPTWDEKGIREEVLEAWRIEQARPQAKARAEKLAERLRGAEKTWSELLLQETVTGEQDGILLQPLISDSFTWMTVQRRSVPTPFGIEMPMEVPVLTDLSTIENEGPKFMRTVFEELKDGDVGVVPNDDLSVYYVVQIRDRTPSTPQEREAQRQRFLQERIFPDSFFPTPYMRLANEQRGELIRAWLDDLKRKYDVQIHEREEEERS